MYHFVNRLSDDELTKETWSFFYDANRHRLRLNGYVYATRPSKRHKFQPVSEKSWNPYGRKTEHGPCPERVPDAVQFEAVHTFADSLVVDILK